MNESTSTTHRRWFLKALAAVALAPAISRLSGIPDDRSISETFDECSFHIPLEFETCGLAEMLEWGEMRPLLLATAPVPAARAAQRLVAHGVPVNEARAAVFREWLVHHEHGVPRFSLAALNLNPALVLASCPRLSSRRATNCSSCCGCYQCGLIFAPTQVTDWWVWADEPQDLDRPYCPHCGEDSILPSASGFPITPAFLQDLGDYCYGPSGRKLGALCFVNWPFIL